MAYETRRIARSTAETLDLEREPQLAVGEVEMSRGNWFNSETKRNDPAYRFAIKLLNPGNTRVQYEFDRLEIQFPGTVPLTQPPDNRGGVIHPKMGGHYFCLASEGEAAVVPGTEGNIGFWINYWTTSERTYHLEVRLRVTVTNTNGDRMNLQWTYLDNTPVYS